MSSELTPPPYLSPSSIGTFNQCPLRFKFSKIDLIPDPPNHYSVLGNFVHDVLEDMYKLEPSLRTVETAKEIAKFQWGSKWKDQAHQVLRTDKEIHNFRWSAWWCIENLWKLENPVEVEPIGLEYELNGSVGGVMMKGFIDRFTQSTDSLMLTVSDYKTGKTPSPAFEDDKFFQLLIYAKLLSELGVGYVDHIELLYLKDGKRLKRVVDEKSLNQTVDTIQETKEEIDKRCSSGYFEPIKSGLCNFCNYKKICPAWGN